MARRKESDKVLILWDIGIADVRRPRRLQLCDGRPSTGLVCAENCRLPKALWRKDVTTQVALRLSNAFGREQGLNHPEMYLAFRSCLPSDAPFLSVIEELRSPGGIEHLSFQPKFHQDGTAVKNHTADDVLQGVICYHLLRAYRPILSRLLPTQLLCIPPAWPSLQSHKSRKRFLLVMQKLTAWMKYNPEGGLVVFITSDSDFLKAINSVVENYKFRAHLIFYGERMSKAPGMREKVNSQGVCYEWMTWLRKEMQMPQLRMHPFDQKLEWESPNRLSGSTLDPCRFCVCFQTSSVVQPKYLCLPYLRPAYQKDSIPTSQGPLALCNNWG